MARRPGLRAVNPDQLTDAMYAANLNTIRLARRVGVTRQHISAVLRGERGISVQKAEALAREFGKPTNALFRLNMSSEKSDDRKELDMSVTSIDIDDPVLFFEEVVEISRIPPGTLRHLRQQGGGPPWSKSGRRLRIRKSAFDAWFSKYDAPDNG